MTETTHRTGLGSIWSDDLPVAAIELSLLAENIDPENFDRAKNLEVETTALGYSFYYVGSAPIEELREPCRECGEKNEPDTRRTAFVCTECRE